MRRRVAEASVPPKRLRHFRPDEWPTRVIDEGFGPDHNDAAHRWESAYRMWNRKLDAWLAKHPDVNGLSLLIEAEIPDAPFCHGCCA